MRKLCHKWDHNDIFWESPVIDTTYTQRYVWKQPIFGPNNNIAIYRFNVWSEGWLKLQSSLEKPSDKCQRTHIIQNSFHDAQIIFWILNRRSASGADMNSIYRDIVVGPKYRLFSDISLCICCVFDRTFPEDIVVVSFMTWFSHKISLWSHLWKDFPIFHIIRGGSGHQDSSIIPL